jgi:hypothetical protein
MLSSVWFTGMCSLNGNVWENPPSDWLRPFFKPNLFPYKYPNIPNHSHTPHSPTYQDRTHTVLLNVGIWTTDAGESPSRQHTIRNLPSNSFSYTEHKLLRSCKKGSVCQPEQVFGTWQTTGGLSHRCESTWLASRLPPLSCCCADHSQFSHTPLLH